MYPLGQIPCAKRLQKDLVHVDAQQVGADRHVDPAADLAAHLHLANVQRRHRVGRKGLLRRDGEEQNPNRRPEQPSRGPAAGFGLRGPGQACHQPRCRVCRHGESLPLLVTLSWTPRRLESDPRRATGPNGTSPSVAVRLWKNKRVAAGPGNFGIHLSAPWKTGESQSSSS